MLLLCSAYYRSASDTDIPFVRLGTRAPPRLTPSSMGDNGSMPFPGGGVLHKELLNVLNYIAVMLWEPWFCDGFP